MEWTGQREHINKQKGPCSNSIRRALILSLRKNSKDAKWLPPSETPQDGGVSRKTFTFTTYASQNLDNVRSVDKLVRTARDVPGDFGTIAGMVPAQPTAAVTSARHSDHKMCVDETKAGVCDLPWDTLLCSLVVSF